MERDAHDSFEATGPGASQPTTGATGGSQSPIAHDIPGTMGEEQRGGRMGQGVDAARQKMERVADQAKQKAGQTAEQMKDKASQLKVTLADKLDSGADKLRHRTQSAAGELEQTMGGNGATTQMEETTDKVSGAVATGMEKTADWLRTADLDTMRADIEQQVRAKPGRSILVALGLGYVLGRIFRSGRQG